MDTRTWWALQISMVIVVSSLSSVVYIYGFGVDPETAISGSILGCWLGVGLNLAKREGLF